MAWTLSPMKDDGGELRDAAAMLAAMDRRDVEGIAVLIKHSDPTALTFGLASIAFDALREDPTSDITGYVERLFLRLGPP